MASNVNVSSTVHIFDNVVNSIERASIESLALTADALLTDVRDEGVMPFNTGNLQNDSTFVDDSGKSSGRVSIVTSTPYARRMYFHPEYNFRKTNNMHAGGKWWESYISGSNKDRAAEIYSKIFKRRGGL